MTPPVRDREEAIAAVRELHLPFVAFMGVEVRELVGQLAREGAERIVDALLGQPTPEVGRDLLKSGAELELEIERLSELIANVTKALDEAKAPATDDALAGVERRAGMPPQGYSLAGRIRALYSRERIEANRQRGRAQDAEVERDDLRAIGDTLQSSASRLAEYVHHLERSGIDHPPYEVEMAAAEVESAAEKWTETRRGEATNRETRAPLPASVSVFSEGSQRGPSGP